MKTINLKKITITGVALLGLGTAAITATNLATEPNVVQAASSKIKVSWDFLTCLVAIKIARIIVTH